MMVTNLNSSILNSAILDSAMLHKTLTQTSSIWLKLIHSDSTWWWQPSWTLPSWIQPFCTKKTSLIHSDSTWWWQPSWICHVWIQPFCTKGTSFIHSDSTWWWQPSWILPCWIQTLPSWIFRHLVIFSQIHSKTLFLLSDNLTQTNSIWLTMIHLEFFHLEFCHLGQNLTQSNSIWLKVIHSDSTYWWQPSWILPCWIQTLPSWIQTPCYLLSDSLKNTLPPLCLWLKLIQSD